MHASFADISLWVWYMKMSDTDLVTNLTCDVC